MSAEILRRAAAAMRERAEAATPGTWMLDPDEEVGTAEVIVEEYECHEVARISCDFGTDAEHIASWHPAVALAVADLLDAAHASFSEASVILAHPWHDESCECLSHKEYRAHLALARAYLGEEA